MRAASTTPRKNSRTGNKAQVYQDEWIQFSDEEQKTKRRSIVGRHHGRRLTDSGLPRSNIAPSPPGTPTPGVGAKEASAEISRLEKENWDLKHRICLQQERAQQLNEQLEAALEQLESSRDLRERNHHLQVEKEKLKERISRRDEAIRKLKEDNKQLNEIQDEMVKEMDQKDEELQRMDQEVCDRQLALEEAAGFIQQLELQVELQQSPKQQTQPQQTTSDRQPDSDYYSADHESDTPARAMKTTPVPTKPMGTPSMQDSDYFSASPNMTPQTPRDSHPQTVVAARDEQRARARASALSFNKEIGLRSIASRDSLFGNFLESPALPKSQPSRTLRRKSSRLRTPISEEESSSGSSTTMGSPTWSNTTRPLRDLYKSGELSRGLADDHPTPPVQYTPSAASFTSREVDDDIFSRGGTTRPSSAASDLTIQSQPPELLKMPSVETPNYDRWPRKLPEWPPSAGLARRDILFHGEEEKKVLTSPKATRAHTTPEMPTRSVLRKTPSPLSQPATSPTTVPPRDSSLRSSKVSK